MVTVLREIEIGSRMHWKQRRFARRFSCGPDGQRQVWAKGRTGDGGTIFACLGSWEVGACGKKSVMGGCGMESGTLPPPCCYLANRGRRKRILAHSAGGWKSLERSSRNFLSRTFFDCTPHQAAQQPLDKIPTASSPSSWLQSFSIINNSLYHTLSEITTSPLPFSFFSIEVLQRCFALDTTIL